MYHYEFTLTVTDAAGLSTTATSLVFPNCCSADFTNDGVVDPDDLADFIGGFFTVPPSLATDFDRSGTIDPDDLADYIGAFFSQPPGAGADFNNDGVVDPDDLADYIGAFFSGCQ